MLSRSDIFQAINQMTRVKDFDGEEGIPVAVDSDGETTVVQIIGENFSRWSDSLDLSIA